MSQIFESEPKKPKNAVTAVKKQLLKSEGRSSTMVVDKKVVTFESIDSNDKIKNFNQDELNSLDIELKNKENLSKSTIVEQEVNRDQNNRSSLMVPYQAQNKKIME